MIGDIGESCRKKKEARIADWLSAPLFEVEIYFHGKLLLMAAIQKERISCDCDILFIRITVLSTLPAWTGGALFDLKKAPPKLCVGLRKFSLLQGLVPFLNFAMVKKGTG